MNIPDNTSVEDINEKVNEYGDGSGRICIESRNVIQNHGI